MPSWFASSEGDEAREFARNRVGIYALLLAGLFATMYLIDLLGSIGQGSFEQYPLPGQLVHIGVTLALAAAGVYARRRAPSPGVVVALEMGATWLIAGFAMIVISQGPRGQAYAGPALAMMLVLVIRSAIVPCSALRTVTVGVVVATAVVWAYARRGDPDDLETEFVGVWMFLFIAASATVSRVIYGLQRRLSRAKKLGQYVLEEQLGAGGMGVVYRARHAMLRRPTAVKLLPPGKTGERYLARFEREVKMTARLSHPNTVTIYDFGRTPDGHFYYAMELLDGANLSEIVEVGGAQPEARVVHILDAIARALVEAHGIGMIHRDIKPSNIMLCTQGGVLDTPKLLDFGLVRDIADATSETNIDTVVGTPLYLSPEAITDPEKVDARSDLYALGAVGYFALTGDHVFSGKTAADVCRKHVHKEPMPPSKRLGRPIDRVVEELVLSCLSKNPDQRPADASEIARRLSESDSEGWLPDDAKAWWDEHASAVERRRAKEREGGLKMTFDVDPRRT